MLGGGNACQHCFCPPHIILNPPAFLLRCLAACLGNISKQFEWYSRFWKLLREIGKWQHVCHLQSKSKFTTKNGCKKILPPHLIPSINGYMEMHDGTLPLIGASQKILPKSKGVLVHGLTSGILSTVSTLLYHIM